MHIADRRRVADGVTTGTPGRAKRSIRPPKSVHINEIRKAWRAKGRANQCRTDKVCWDAAAESFFKVANQDSAATAWRDPHEVTRKLRNPSALLKGMKGYNS
ncbi:hypothetical protein RERY_00650 [Rhodococcus erythropolis]|nr:hypothetical protein RERY_00650 [Rhodococcus erythropolis]